MFGRLGEVGACRCHAGCCLSHFCTTSMSSRLRTVLLHLAALQRLWALCLVKITTIHSQAWEFSKHVPDVPHPRICRYRGLCGEGCGSPPWL